MKLLHIALIVLMFVGFFWMLTPKVIVCGEDSSRVKCASNLKQIGQALLFYASEHDGALAPNLLTLFLTEDLVGEVFICPTSGDTPTKRELRQARIDFASGKHNSYAYSPPFKKWNELDPNDVIAFEQNTHIESGMNVLFGDGRVEFLMGEPVFSIYDQFGNGIRPIRLLPSAHWQPPATSKPIVPTTSPTKQAHN